MRLIKCDFCGAEIREDYGWFNKKGRSIPKDEGWGVLELKDVKVDICPRCIPKGLEDERES